MRSLLCKGEGLPHERSSADDRVAIFPHCVVGGVVAVGGLLDVIGPVVLEGRQEAVDGLGGPAAQPVIDAEPPVYLP